MLYRMRSTCLRRLQRWRTACAVAAAATVCLTVRAQDLGTVNTLGGTGDPGYIDGVKGTSQFNGPAALALRGDGNLFIADQTNNAVRYLRLSDTKVRTFVRPNQPVGLAFDSKTNLFVASQSDGTITKYDYFANIRATLRPALAAGPLTALGIDRNDNLYAAELNGTVLRMNPSGAVDSILQAPGAGPHEFRGVAVTDDGVVYVSDAAAHVIWRFVNGAGSLFAGTLNQKGSTLGEVGFGRLNRPHQIAVGPNGSVVIADRGNQQIRVASCEGIVTVLYGIDPADWFTVNAPGVYPGWWDSTADFTEVREPVGVAADRLGNVYDSEVYYNLVRAGTGMQFPLACNTTAPASTNTPPSLVLQPNSGFYPNGVTITISASNSVSGFSRDTHLFYDLSGTEPTPSDIEIPIMADGRAQLTLPGPVDLAGLRVRAFIGTTGGVTASAQPTQVPTPVLSPDSGYYPMGIDINITSTNGFPDGTVLYYTLDGSVPTTNSPALKHDGTRAVLGWNDAQHDLRSLKVRAVLGPNLGAAVGGKAVNFPGEPEIQGEIGIPPARNGYRAGIGSFYILPIVANLRDAQQLQSLQFVIELAPLPGSPRLERDDLQILPMSTNDFISVLPASTLPPDSKIPVARNGTNRLAVAYFGTNSGFNVTAGYAVVAMLGIQFRAEDALGTTAEEGDGYTIRVTQVTGTSDGRQTLLPLKPMPDRTIQFQNIQFREGDTSPAYWYNAGDFGNGALESGDVNSAIFAAFGFLRPYPLSDAFAAMDVYRIGILENVVEYNDAATILRRSLGFESADVFRVRDASGEWVSSVTPAAPRLRNSLRALAAGAPAWSRDVTLVGGVLDRVTAVQGVSVPVYMKVAPGASVSGMQFVADVVPVDGAPAVSGVSFLPSSSMAAPTTYGSDVPGRGRLPSTVYARWDNLDNGLTGTVLLGWVQFVTPSTVLAGEHYNIMFHDIGGASISPDTGSLTAYLFQSIHGEVWPFAPHPAGPQLSDEWKAYFFGSLTDPAAEPNADPDGDGFTNAEEFLVGTDPTAPDWHVRTQDSHVSFRWVGQTGKTYKVEKTQDFKTWNPATGPLSGQDSFLEYNELTTPAKAQFYRLNIQ